MIADKQVFVQPQEHQVPLRMSWRKQDARASNGVIVLTLEDDLS